MKTKKDHIIHTERSRPLHTKLVGMFIAIALMGVGILLYESITGQSSTLLSSLVVLVISIAALIMTTLQSASIRRQLKLTESVLRKTDDSNREVEMLVKEDHKLRDEIHQDMKLDQRVISVLEEYGIGSSRVERQKVAQAITALQKK